MSLCNLYHRDWESKVTAQYPVVGISFVVVWCLIECEMAESLVVTCPLGSVEGSVYTTQDGEDIYAFQGVPYGKPPTGNLRFKVI